MQNLNDDCRMVSARFAEALARSRGKPFAFDHGGMRSLHFDGQYLQSVMRIAAPDELLLNYTKAMMAFLLARQAPRHILMIGLGGGSLAKYCYRFLPATRITVVELDRHVIALRGAFALPKDDVRFQIVHADACDFLNGMQYTVDVILHDGFVADGLAASLSTEAFYRRCHEVLDADGVLVSNVFGTADNLIPVMLRLRRAFGPFLWWGDRAVASTASFFQVNMPGRCRIARHWQGAPSSLTCSMAWSCAVLLSGCVPRVGGTARSLRRLQPTMRAPSSCHVKPGVKLWFLWTDTQCLGCDKKEESCMTGHSQTIKFFRSKIPTFDCVPGCHDCCGPVRTSTEEIARLPVKSDSEHAAALAAWSCPYLSDRGCEVYSERPLICRLFGTTPRLACPNGRRPAEMIAPDVEQDIFRYFKDVRHVLV